MIHLSPSDAWIPFCFVAFLLAFVPFLVIFARKEAARRKQNLEEATRPYGGRYVEGGWLSQSYIELTIHGVEARLSTYAGSKNSPAYTRIELPIGAKGRLRVNAQGAFMGLRKFFGAQDVEIGDPAFDDAYQIESSPEEYARRLLTPEIRRSIVSLAMNWYPTWDVQPARTTISVNRELSGDIGELQRFLKEAAVLIGAMQADLGGGRSEVQVVAVTAAAPGGNCLTCGTDLDATAVACAKCGTQQHKDCWTYVAGCATYACGSTKYR